jgi:hypothetical protein
MSRNTINRITSRIEGLTDRLTPDPEWLTIVGGTEAHCRKRLEKIEEAGERRGRHVRFIITGVVRDDDLTEAPVAS